VPRLHLRLDDIMTTLSRRKREGPYAFKVAGRHRRDWNETLPHNLRRTGPGAYQAQCNCCKEWGEIYCEIKEALDGPFEHYCGRSDRCLP